MKKTTSVIIAIYTWCIAALYWVILFLLFLSTAYLLVFGLPDRFKKEVKVEVIKTVPVEKEVIKYIEKDGIPLHEFVTHFNHRVDPLVAKQIGNSVKKYSKKYQLPEKLILSIIKKESSYNPFAKSSVAFGLMQVYPKFHKDKMKKIGIKDNKKLYDIDININIGCQIFREYLDKSKGDLDETFHRYLSKKATRKQKDAYKNEILNTFAEMEFMEHQRMNSGKLGESN